MYVCNRGSLAHYSTAFWNSDTFASVSYNQSQFRGRVMKVFNSVVPGTLRKRPNDIARDGSSRSHIVVCFTAQPRDPVRAGTKVTSLLTAQSKSSSLPSQQRSGRQPLDCRHRLPPPPLPVEGIKKNQSKKPATSHHHSLLRSIFETTVRVPQATTTRTTRTKK
jgi:hypothetical protein